MDRRSSQGRGAGFQPANRFTKIHVEEDLSHGEHDDQGIETAERAATRTEYFEDETASILSENNSPDIPFRWSVNPYRGCQHGCAYCYARPTHEYLGLSAGLDFETKVFVKLRAAELLRDRLATPAWDAEPIMFSGVTDCYQPVERQLELTRQCLQVCLSAGQPITIITKNRLVTRDLDILAPMAAQNLARVAVSLTTLDKELASQMEPRTSTPAARLEAIRQLSAGGVPVRVMVAPVIPGLTDSEIPSILQAASAAGASSAGYILLRLPDTVAPVFREWLERVRPLQKDRVESRIRQMRGGRLNDATFETRLRGTGPLADQIQQTFRVFAKRHGLVSQLPPLDRSQFVHPVGSDGQLRLFD